MINSDSIKRYSNQIFIGLFTKYIHNIFATVHILKWSQTNRVTTLLRIVSTNLTEMTSTLTEITVYYKLTVTKYRNGVKDSKNWCERHLCIITLKMRTTDNQYQVKESKLNLIHSIIKPNPLPVRRCADSLRWLSVIRNGLKRNTMSREIGRYWQVLRWIFYLQFDRCLRRWPAGHILTLGISPGYLYGDGRVCLRPSSFTAFR